VVIFAVTLYRLLKMILESTEQIHTSSRCNVGLSGAVEYIWQVVFLTLPIMDGAELYHCVNGVTSGLESWRILILCRIKTPYIVSNATADCLRNKNQVCQHETWCKSVRIWHFKAASVLWSECDWMLYVDEMTVSGRCSLWPMRTSESWWWRRALLPVE